ncbi:hypothetical protein R0K04_25520, partial [Pseudoalteromonas sp. SIMBA_153]
AMKENTAAIHCQVPVEVAAFLLNEQPVTQFGSRESGTFIRHASDLEEGMLQQCFQLLLNAHYRSSPNDLNLLLTEPGHKLAYQSTNG